MAQGTRLTTWPAALLAFSLLCGAGGAQKERRPCLDPDAAARLLLEEKERVLARLVPPGEKRERYLSRFRVIVSEHFVLITNGPRTTHKFRTTLEELYRFVKRYYPYVAEGRPLKCYIFRSRQEYWDFCVKIAGWSLPRARATAGHATAAYYATFYQSPTASVVMHEATHLLVNAVCRVQGGGSWFQEGLAVFIEKKIGGRNPCAGWRSAVKAGRYHPLTHFVRIPVLLGDGRLGRRNYAQAGCLVAFMVEGPLRDRFPAFMAYLRERPVRRPEEVAAAVRAVYGLSLEEFEAAWLRYLGVRSSKPR